MCSVTNRFSTTAPHTACVGLGANLGDRASAIRNAFASLADLPDTHLIATSAVIETDPVGPPGQGPYLNAAARLETALPPALLLDRMLHIERAAGRDRTREARWGPRTLDLDLLLYGDLTLDQPGLTLPHPRMHERRFVLEPLAQVAGEVVVPGFGLRVSELLDALLRADPLAPIPFRP